MNDILLTTTPTIEGAEIEQYLGIVSAHQVAGTGFFSDFIASFSDIFGGHSGTYRNQMEDLARDVNKQLLSKARELGANAIIGLALDYDNISAKNMSMFMVSARGTAVRCKFKTKEVQHVGISSVSSNVLEQEVKGKIIKTHIETIGRLKDDEWQYLLSHQMTNIAPTIISHYINVKSLSYDQQPYLSEDLEKYVTAYLRSLPYDIVVDLLYNKETIDKTKSLIQSGAYFNAKKVLSLMEEGNPIDYINLLKVEKQTYNASDLADMKLIVNKLDNLPEIGSIQEVKGGMFSSSGLKYICPNGHKNDPNSTFCSDCFLDIHGLTSGHHSILNQFKMKVEALEAILNN